MKLDTSPAGERARILRRLERFAEIHISTAAGIAAAKVLADRAQVRLAWEGDLCIVRRLTDAPRPKGGAAA